MRPTPPYELPALSISHRDDLRRGSEAVPDLLDQLQPIGGTERENFPSYATHARIVC